MIVREKNRKIFVLSSLVLALVGCSGGKDDTPNNTANTVQPNHNANAIGGAGEMSCTAELGAKDSSHIRQARACNYAKKIYGNVDKVTFNYDYKDEDYRKVVGIEHTGIDLQGYPKGDANIQSLTAGKVHVVDGKGGDYGMVVVETVLAGEPIQIAYLHMKNIQVTDGDIISQGDILGTEAGRGKEYCNNDKSAGGRDAIDKCFSPHLHLEFRNNNMNPKLPLSQKSTEVLDPLSDRFYQAIMSGNFALPSIQPTTPIYPNNPPPIHPTTPVIPPTPTVQRPYLEGGVNIVPLNDRSFQLNSRTATGDVSYYELWRSNSSGQRGSKLGTSSNNYFTDTPPMGQTVYYTIGACNSAGCSYSSQDYGTIEKPRPQFYNGTSGVNIERTSSGFRLNSRQATHAEYYKLYRSRYAGSKGEYITSSSSNYFTDNNVQ